MVQFQWQLILLSFLFYPQYFEAQSTPIQRIINGFHAEPKQFPYQVLLNSPTVWEWWPLCGGVIISNRVILTAAHCVDYDIDILNIYFGTVDRNNNKETGQQRLIVKGTNIVVHPEWDPNQNINDIALIKLPADLQFDDYIQPAQLPDPNQFYENESGVISGWGQASVPGLPTNTLMALNVTILSNEECKSIQHKYSPGGFFSSSWICVMSSDSSPCYGDSGGPLAIRSEDGRRYRQGQSGREDQSREKAQLGEKINESPFMMCRSESPFVGGLDHIKWLKGTETVTNIHKIRDTKQFLNGSISSATS
ncbi:hypothetical protein ACLKA7_017225 [Drosophila subpalustris]